MFRDFGWDDGKRDWPQTPRLTLDECRRYAKEFATREGVPRVVVSTPDGVYSHTTLETWQAGGTYGPGCFVVGEPIQP